MKIMKSQLHNRRESFWPLGCTYTGTKLIIISGFMWSSTALAWVFVNFSRAILYWFPFHNLWGMFRGWAMGKDEISGIGMGGDGKAITLEIQNDSKFM
jgi:hypothetical protein